MATLRKQKGTIGNYGRYGGYLSYSSSSTNTSVTASVSAGGGYLYCSYSGNGDTYSRTATDTYYWYFEGNTAWGNSMSGTYGSHYCGAQSYYDIQWKSYSSTKTWNKTTSAQTKHIYLNTTNGSSSQASASISVPALTSYTVTYNGNGATSNSKGSETVYYGNTGTFPTTSQCTRTNYTLLGWATSSSATTASYNPGAATPTITSAKTYYAVWKQNYHVTVSFNVNGGAIPDNPHVYNTDYYWKVTNNLIYLSRDGSSYSKYTKQIEMSTTQWDCYNDTSFGLSRTPGYHLVSGSEWCLNSNGTGNTFSQDTSGGNHWTTKRLNGGTEITSNVNVTVYANWEPNWWKIHFDGNGATSGSMSDQRHTYGTALALPTNGFTKTGYNFSEWKYTNSGGTVYTYQDQYNMPGTWTSTNGNTYTFYAQWTAKQTAVTFNPNGGRLDNNGNWGSDANTTNSHVNTMTYNSSSYYAHGGATRTGYTFGGWNTKQDGTGYTVWSAGGACTTEGGYWSGTGSSAKWQSELESLTLYAKWTANTYTIKYDGNGADGGSTASSTHTYGVSKNLTSNGYTKTGCSFLGWSQVITGNTIPTYSNGQSVSNLTTTSGAVITLYAVWDAPAMYARINGAWVKVTDPHFRDGGVWKPILAINAYISGTPSATCTHANASTVKLSYCIGEHEFDCCVDEGEYQNWSICPDCGMVRASATGNPDEYISCDICDTEASWNDYRDTWLPVSTFPNFASSTAYTNRYNGTGSSSVGQQIIW